MQTSITTNVLAKRKSGHQLRVEQMMLKIREFSDMAKFPSVPTAPEPTMLLKQCKLVFEETMELLEACGVKVVAPGEFPEYDQEVLRDCAKLSIKCTKIDLTEIAKEAADVSVVTTGLLSECGIADVPILEEVDANNLAKFGPGGYLDENRKWRKPPNHPKPDIGALLMAQGWTKPEVSRDEPAQ